MTTTNRVLKLIVLVLLYAGCSLCVARGVPASNTATSSAQEELQSINEYGKQVETYYGNHPETVRHFADVARKGTPQWREFSKVWNRASPLPYFQQVDVSIQNGRSLYAYAINYGVNSDGIWHTITSYVFREDGTLARAWSAIIIRKEDKPKFLVVQKWFYSSRGDLLRYSKDILDAQARGKKVKRLASARFVEVPIAVYKSVRDLPFYNLLKKPKP